MSKRLVKSAVGIVSAGVIFLVSLEIVGRVFDPLGISYYPETAAYLDTLVIEEPIGYRNRPGLKGEFWGAPVSINSLGLRGQEVNLKPAEDEFRILLLGDSLVFGIGLPDQYTIPQQLEQQLNHDSEGIVFKVINMGVPSYNTEQELVQLQTVGFSLNPHLVMLIFTINDLQPKMWVIERRASPWVNIAQRSYAMSLLALGYWELHGNDDRVPYLKNLETHPRWPVVETALAKIAKLCEAKGVPFVLFTRESSPRLGTIPADLGVPLIDLQPMLEDPRWNKPGVALTVSAVDPHPNRAGAAIYSTLLRQGLERLGLLPTGQKRPNTSGGEHANAPTAWRPDG